MLSIAVLRLAADLSHFNYIVTISTALIVNGTKCVG